VNASDRKLLSAEFGRGIAMLRLGDREGTLALLRRLQGLVTGREPEIIEPEARFHCERLDAELSYQSCVAMQVENEKNLRKRKARAGSDGNTARHRGKCPENPTCQTSECPRGRAIRDRLARDGKGKA
jgi:hypothetical protein